MLGRCEAVAGDVSQLNLGLSAEDRKRLTDEVNLIWHCAATIRFDEPLKKAVLLNTRGTKFMIDLAKDCKQLDVSDGLLRLKPFSFVLISFRRCFVTCRLLIVIWARGFCTRNRIRRPAILMSSLKP